MKYELMASNVESLYDSVGGVLACRRFAVRNEENRKDAIVPMRCYNDGSAQDATAVTISGKLTGQLGLNRDGGKPEFIVTDGSGNNWGESFRFDKVLYNYSGAHQAPTGYHWSVLRSISLQNGDRAYYGLLSRDDPAKEFRVNLEEVAAGTWELWSINQDGVETLFSSGSVGSAFTLGNLPYGRYKLQIDSEERFHAEIRQQVYEPVFGTAYPMWDTSKVDGVPATGFAAGVENVYFNVYDNESRLAIIYHDVSANTATLYADSNSSCSMRTKSVAAVENEDENIAVFYAHSDSVEGEHALLGQTLSYRVFDVETKTWADDRNTIQLIPDLDTDVNYRTGSSVYFVHAFDVVKRGPKHYTVCFSARYQSETIDVTSMDGTSVSTRPILRSPVLSDGFFAVELRDLPLNQNAVLDSMPVATVRTPSFFNLFVYRDPDYNYPPWRIARNEVDYIKCEYSPERDKVVAAVLDFHHRCPIVVAGQNDSWSEVGVPLIPSMIEYMFDDGSPTPIENQSTFGVESVHAAFGYDGMIYCVTNRPKEYNSGLELAVMDPSLIDDGREAFVGRGRAWTNETNGAYAEDSWDVYAPYYRQQRFPLGGVQASADYGPEFASISKIDQHLVVGLAGSGIEHPIVLQNMEYDGFPFRTTEQDVYHAEYGANTPWSRQAGIGSGDEGHFYCIGEGAFGGNGYVERNITALVDQLVTGEHAADIGYKFHAKFEAGNGADCSNLTAFPSNSPVFAATGTYDDGVTRYKLRTRFRIDGADLLCEYNNGTTWVTLKTFTSYLSAPEIVDYFILMKFHEQDSGSPKAAVRFVYKRRDQYVTKGGTGQYEDYRNPYVMYGIALDTEEDASATGSVQVRAGGGIGADKVNVFQVGWNVLNVWDGFSSTQKGGSERIDVSWQGETWRDLNDRAVFNMVGPQADPSFRFKALTKDNIDPVTSLFHWPNGFKYQFSGQTLGGTDTWELSRQVISNTSYLLSSRLHGAWWTSNDDSAVYIWADAQDSNMDKFIVNCFMVQGCNSRIVTLVGKDNIGDAWIEIEQLDLKRYSLQGLSHIEASGVDIVTVNNAAFLEGTFGRGFTHYYEAEGADNAEIISANGDELVLKSDLVRSETEGVIFGTDGVKTLEESVSYRYIGIKLDDNKTADDEYVLYNFDFGYSGDVFQDFRHRFNTGMSVRSSGSILVVEPEQGVRTKSLKEKAQFEFAFTFTDAEVYANVLSIVDKVSKSARPVWVYRDSVVDPALVWLCLIDGNIQHNTVVDESGDIYYQIGLTLRSVS